MRDDFAIFILSNKRANRVHTITSLMESNYTGKWYIVVDNLDDTIEEYKNIFPIKFHIDKSIILLKRV